MNCGATHYEDCPCHEARRDAEIERLRSRVSELEDGIESIADDLLLDLEDGNEARAVYAALMLLLPDR